MCIIFVLQVLYLIHVLRALKIGTRIKSNVGRIIFAHVLRACGGLVGGAAGLRP